MKNKCRYCEILEEPRDYFDWILYETKDWIIGGRHFKDMECIFKVHCTMPGGHKLNQILEKLSAATLEGEKLEYRDHDHYNILVRRISKSADRGLPTQKGI